MTESDRVEILLIEDNTHDAMMAMRALRKHHLADNLHHVTDGVEALDFIFANSGPEDRINARFLKVILLDLKLAKLDGFKVLSRIKSDDRTRSIPVVALTSSKEERDLTETYRLGVNSYIVKPVDYDEFVEAISLLGLYWLRLNQSGRS
jgi:two-component system response regulator